MRILILKNSIHLILSTDVYLDSIDAVMFANEMNKHPNLAKKLQYDFFLNSLRKRKRYSPWLRKEQIENLELVKRYYGYSNEKAKQVLNILTREQFSFIRDRLETGGRK